MNESRFRYDEAFSRNLGWVSEEEQQRLKSKCVAVAGLGGVGGSHLLTLARLGIGSFHIADFDRFGLVNFNRQAGATVAHLDEPKLDVLAAMALDINPELQIERFPLGVTEGGIDTFLEGVDLFVDGLDFFALGIRSKVFARCAELGIPAVTAAPLGMGVALVTFMPGSMTFEQYFQLAGRPPEEQAMRFLMGLAPRLLQLPYLVDRSRVDLRNKSGPSTIMACQLCAGFAATECLKILLGRGRVLRAPHSIQFDAFRYRLVRNWRPGGNNNPIQKLALTILRRQVKIQERRSAAAAGT